MRNLSLVEDYIKRASIRLKAVDALFDGEGWADVVRESQELVELCLKALLRNFDIEVPRIHDVGAILLENKSMFPAHIQKELAELAEISHQLRRDRELAFYGSEDLTPSEFYRKKEALEARKHARHVVEVVTKACSKGS